MIEEQPSMSRAVLETLGVICREKPREADARKKRQNPLYKEGRGEKGNGVTYFVASSVALVYFQLFSDDV